MRSSTSSARPHGFGTPEQSHRKQEDRAQKIEHANRRDAYEAERQKQEPDEGIGHEREQGERPTENEEKQPQQEFRHTSINTELTLTRFNRAPWPESLSLTAL